jgi:hypothetical protein
LAKPPPPPKGGTLDPDAAKIFYFIPKVEMNMKDELRQKELEALVLKIIRFTTKEITNELESVLQTIEKHLK